VLRGGYMVGWRVVGVGEWGVVSRCWMLDASAFAEATADKRCWSILRPEKIGTAKDEMLVRW